MDSLEPKKLALIRILQILRTHSDFDHPVTQDEISAYLEKEYGIAIERKAIGRNISLLREAGYQIESCRNGSYIDEREFEDSELHLLIDSVLSSRHITARHSEALIEKLCNMSSKFFRSHVKNIFSVNDWSKTENQSLFYNIEVIDEAIEQKRQIELDYSKYGTDKKLHRTTTHRVSAYQLILHNQRYYLMAYNEHWGNMSFLRVDRITNMTITDKPSTPITSIEGYENGIDYKMLSTAMPYMFTDKPENITFIAEEYVIDQVVDWFGDNAQMQKEGDKVRVKVKASPNAMEFWALQYIKCIEVKEPLFLRERIKDTIKEGFLRYQD